ncbi:uncharacterized protein LOC129740111 [Uranotaenia lowii]|uniref:uncharacterized protein LOC129740111 n=1 Tax=Uranotaenia lowii TaxID=190385 RepID=UPI00247ADB04|nr:uncharacterized protein LOC129740111 [Uranotaenia lowii]
MRLLKAALMALVVMGSEVLAAPCCRGSADYDPEMDRIDPVKSEDSFSEDVSRTKRKFKPEELERANLILSSLDEPKNQDESQLLFNLPGTTRTMPSPAPGDKMTKMKMKLLKSKKTRQASDDGEENGTGADEENSSFGTDGKVTLQIPGKLFGNATNLFLHMAKIFGDFITNSAIRSARFLQLFQPWFGRNLYIQIPSTTTESNEV